MIIVLWHFMVQFYISINFTWIYGFKSLMYYMISHIHWAEKMCHNGIRNCNYSAQTAAVSFSCRSFIIGLQDRWCKCKHLHQWPWRPIIIICTDWSVSRLSRLNCVSTVDTCRWCFIMWRCRDIDFTCSRWKINPPLQ